MKTERDMNMRKSISINENLSKRTSDKPLNIIAKLNESPVKIALKDEYNVAILFGNEDSVKIYLLEKESYNPIGHYNMDSIQTLKAFLSDCFAPPIFEKPL